MMRLRAELRIAAVLGVSAASAAPPCAAQPCPATQLQHLIPELCEFGTFGERVTLNNDWLAVGLYNAGGGLVKTYHLDQAIGFWRFDADLVTNRRSSSDAFGYSVDFLHEDRLDRWRLAIGNQSRSAIHTSAGPS